MANPQTIVVFEDKAVRVWATSATHMGFDAGYTGRGGIQTDPLEFNRVEYMIRFDAKLVDGEWALCGKEYGRGEHTQMSYHNHVFLSRSGWSVKEPTASATHKVIAYAKRLIPFFTASATGQALLVVARKERAGTELVAKGQAVNLAERALHQAKTEYQAAFNEAIAAGHSAQELLSLAETF